MTEGSQQTGGTHLRPWLVLSLYLQTYLWSQMNTLINIKINIIGNSL